MSERSVMTRLAVSAVALLLAMTGLGFRLAFLHLGPHEALRRSVEANRRWQESLPVRRGTIVDCRGEQNILAVDRTVKHVCAEPERVVAADAVVRTASVLAEHLDLPTDSVAVRLNRPEASYTRIKRYVPVEELGALRREDLPGVFFEDARLRYYPQGRFMCHVLGFVNHENVPGGGVELSMHEYLKGCPGLLVSRKNALRQELYNRRDRYIPSVAGADVRLTLDQNIQYAVEKALDGVMEEHAAKGAWAIVQRVSTGEILAMASRPAFDPNRFNEVDSQDPFKNRAIAYVYEPGSTLKVATIAAALNEGTVHPDSVFDCENGAWWYGNHVLHDYKAFPRLTLADGLKKSSNILTAKVALTLREETLYRYLRDFGLGGPLEIDLPGEEHGILHPVSSWSAVSASRIGIGQGVAVTALQMLGVVAAIANDGCLMRPYCVASVRRPGGVVLARTEPRVLSRPIRPETARLMRALMYRVTEEGGTGWRARVPGYTVAGKTGTAQKPVAGGYSSTAYIASFAGFVPADKPEIAAIVVVDEPQPQHTGGRVAAPAFATIAAETARYLGLPPARERRSLVTVNREERAGGENG
ncbi:MAG: penicillin-binding protein 2 [Lentisphaerae bacterium]|nr:penicillin-binding protein 2 [Lentisphaerota bacterium]